MKDRAPANMDAATVQAVASLASLDLEPAEVVQFERDLGRILGYFEQLQAVDTSEVSPMVHATGGPTPLRADEISASLGSDLALANAPASSDQGFVVPRVIGT